MNNSHYYCIILFGIFLGNKIFLSMLIGVTRIKGGLYVSVLRFVFFLFSNFYWLGLHNGACVALANL